MAKTNNEDAEQTRKEEEPELIHAFYGSDTFVKIKQAFEIGRVLFSFKNKKTGENIDCYMSIKRIRVLADDINRFLLERKITDEKKKGEQYPKPVWFSPLGGSAREKISRSFTISPSSRNNLFACITATQCPATISAEGKIIPVSKTHENENQFITIRVGISNYDDLREFAITFNDVVKGYVEKRYSLVNMQSRYHHANADDYIENAPSDENDDEENACENTAAPVPSIDNQNEAADDGFVPSDSWRAEAGAKVGQTQQSNENNTTKNENVVSPSSVKPYKVKSTSQIEKMANKDFYYLPAITAENEKKVIIFSKESINNVEHDKWERFLQAPAGTLVNLVCAEYKDKLLFNKFA